MSDRRVLASNGRVAAAELRGQVAAERFVEGEIRCVSRTLATIWADQAATRRERQLVFGEGFRVLEVAGGMAFGVAVRDGYVGYLAASDLRDAVTPTHRVCVPATHLYPAPDIKAIEARGLSFGSAVRIVGQAGDFDVTDEELFIWRAHLRPEADRMPDPAAVAELFLGVPYLWGGNSAWGIDCSGLVQASCLACGIACPGDADQQMAAVGTPLAQDAPLARGDLIFWAGHVAIAVDDGRLIHANAHHMAVAHEPAAEAAGRIAQAGSGPVLARKRLIPRA